MSLLAKVNDNDMDVDEATGNVASVNAWPPIHLGRSNQVSVPPGFYTPIQLKKKKKELKTRMKYKTTELSARLANPMLAGTKMKAPILKEPRTQRLSSLINQQKRCSCQSWTSRPEMKGCVSMRHHIQINTL